MNRWTVLFVALLAFAAMSCSGGGDTPVTPSDLDMAGPSGQAVTAQNHLWGYYDCYVDLDTQTVEAVVNRNVMFAANVVTFVNGSPANLAFLIKDTPVTPDYIDVDITVGITHPFPGMSEYDGYDVRGIFLGDGSDTLSYNSDLDFAVHNADQSYIDPEVVENDTDVVMPDGYTRWWNPSEFTAPGVLGYTPGLYASGGFAGTATINAYMYFADGLTQTGDLWDFLMGAPEDSGVFSAGLTNRRDYYLRFPNTKGVVFGYAICANWEAEDVHPSNAPEAVACQAVIEPDVYYVDDTDNGGDIKLDISLWNWEPYTQPTGIFVESNVVSSMYTLDTTDMTPTGGGANYSTYHVEVPTDNVTGNEGNEFWVIAEYDGLDYTNDFGVPNTANTDTLAAFFRYDLFTADYAYNADPICDLIVVTPMPASEWNEVPVEFDATGTYDPDVGDVLTFEWDFNGNLTYGESPEDDYTGDQDHPTHAYTEDYTGIVNLRVTDGNGGEAVCSTDPLDIAIKGCDSLNIPTGGAVWSGSTTMVPYAYYGCTLTKGDDQCFVGRMYPSTYDHQLGAMPVAGAWSSSNCIVADATPSNIYVNGYYGYKTASDNTVYYGVYNYYDFSNYYQRYRIYTMDWDDDTQAWGSYSDWFLANASLPGTYTLNNFTLDDEDNPIIWGYDYYNSSNKKIFHWNGTSFDETDLSTTVTEMYYYFQDLEWLPGLEQYVIGFYIYFSSPYHYENKYYVINADDGTVETTIADVFSFASYASYRSGVYIDQENPDCRVLFYACGSFNGTGIPMARYNAIFDDTENGQVSVGSYYPSYYGRNGDYSSEMDRLYTGQQTTSAMYFDMPTDW